MTSAPISTDTTGIASGSTKETRPQNKEIIERIFEDAKNTLKNEYDTMIIKIKEDLNKSKHEVINKLKKL